MFWRSLRPLTSRAATLAANPVQSSTPLKPSSIRTRATTAQATASEPAPIPTPSETNATRQLPYFVGRNNLNNLAIYHKNKRGGNLKLTLLKYGEGDLMALKQDIKTALKLSEGEVSVNSVTNHIVIKGHKRDQVLNFLCTMGF
ncbi:mitochondrial large subunit ribosomal protein-domain-containing protein [Xylaria sp. FL0064]|nr:mitochondrial large subunit ribosomal protein-domain-containing protein [Xylaria sp. FL0064]